MDKQWTEVEGKKIGELPTRTFTGENAPCKMYTVVGGREDDYGFDETIERFYVMKGSINHGEGLHSQVCIEIVDLHDCMSEDEAKKAGGQFLASIQAVRLFSKRQMKTKICQKVMRSCYMTTLPYAYDVAHYGLCASLAELYGNNEDELLTEAKKQAIPLKGLIGFYLDRPQNAIGSTGWDFLRGDIDRPLREYQKQKKGISI